VGLMRRVRRVRLCGLGTVCLAWAGSRTARIEADGRDGDRAALTRVAHPIPMGRFSTPMTEWEGTASC
jgi:hypothetical protein